MVKLSMNFKIHHPFLLKEYKVFDIGNDKNYFDCEQNKNIIQDIGKKYIKTNKLLLELFEKYQNKFKISFAISGTTLELFEKYSIDTLKSFQQLAQTNNVEFIGETYYHSLSFLYSQQEYLEQIQMHKEAIEKYFKQTPTTFRNTHMIYSNKIAQIIAKTDFKNILIETDKNILGWRSQNYMYESKNKEIKLTIKNKEITTEMISILKNSSSPDNLVENINNQKEDITNISLKYELFDSNTKLEYLKKFVKGILSNQNNSFLLPKQILEQFEAKETLDISNLINNENESTNLNELLGNNMQLNISDKIYSMENKVKEINNLEMLDQWRKFTTSNNFYFLTTNHFENKNENKKITNMYESPYDAYSYFITALQDLILNIENKIGLNNPVKTPSTQEIDNDDN